MATIDHNPTVCVIGAGSSGITAVKALLERKIPFDCFEKSDQVGGNWVFDNRNGVSAAYRDLFINVSRERMAYSDYPMTRSYPDFPHHTQVKEYFDSYVDHFGLRSHITFETSVERASRRSDGVWEIELETGEMRHYDVLLVANGHHWDQRWPEPPFPGADEFAGLQLHSHAYRDSADFAGKDVIVVGIGNSAMDIAVEASYAARNTYLSTRSGAWILPKYLFGRPIDQIATNPRIPFRVRRFAMEKILLAYSGSPERYGLPKPDHRVADAHPTISGRIFDRLAHGAITPKPNIARLEADAVVFVDGSTCHADVIVYCTGYKITFPFFDPEFVSAPDNHVALFRRVFHPDINNLFFIGLLQPLGAIMPLAEAQGAWVGDYLLGRYALPAPADMRADIAADQEAMRKRYVASKRHTIQVDFDDYLHELKKERQRGAARAQRHNNRRPIPALAGSAAVLTAAATSVSTTSSMASAGRTQ
jgi:dimethylaniline monooxygenase (N-oxide forming)